MAYLATSMVRRDIIGYIGDSGTRPDSVKYEYGYITADVAATVETAGYFDAATFLNAGDVIQSVMNAGVGDTPVVKTYVVTANNLSAAGHIVIGLQTVAAG